MPVLQTSRLLIVTEGRRFRPPTMLGAKEGTIIHEEFHLLRRAAAVLCGVPVAEEVTTEAITVMSAKVAGWRQLLKKDSTEFARMRQIVFEALTDPSAGNEWEPLDVAALALAQQLGPE